MRLVLRSVNEHTMRLVQHVNTVGVLAHLLNTDTTPL